MAARQAEAQRQAELDKKQRAVQRQVAQEEQRKEDAWEKYFNPTTRCQMPESQGMIQVCQANESKHRAKFEAIWAAKKGIQLR